MKKSRAEERKMFGLVTTVTETEMVSLYSREVAITPPPLHIRGGGDYFLCVQCFDASCSCLDTQGCGCILFPLAIRKAVTVQEDCRPLSLY